MADYIKPIEYHENDCIFRYNQSSGVLQVKGTPENGRPVILKLCKQGWLPVNVRAIWFSGDPAIMLTGEALVLYLTIKPSKPRRNRTFKEIVRSS